MRRSLNFIFMFMLNPHGSNDDDDKTYHGQHATVGVLKCWVIDKYTSIGNKHTV